MLMQEVDIKAISRQSDDAVIDRDQIRMARTGLGWTAEELSRRARLSIATIRRAEAGTPPGISEGNMLLIQHTFEEVGVVFLDEDQSSPGGGRGLRLPRGGAP